MNQIIKYAIALAVVIPGLAISDEPLAGPDSLGVVAAHYMAEEHRSSMLKVVVLPGASPPDGAITGSYEKETDGLLDGISKGAEIGIFRKDIGGIPIAFPIPVLVLPGAIFGGVSGTLKRQMQDFRDTLTNDLAAASDSPLSNDALATDVFWRLRDVPNLKPKVFALSTPIPKDTDAILYVSFSESSINVDGNLATITFAATGTLRRLSDGRHLYEHQVEYQDSDTLSNWTKNGNAAWHDYANFARHYVGREIVAELYERVDVQHTLRPKASDTVTGVKKNDWDGVSRTATPTLAWDLSLSGDDPQQPWTNAIEKTDISYDVEIYDLHRLVYSARNVEAAQHTVEIALEACKTYRWSVRPSYRVDDTVRSGRWMRFGAGAGNRGKAAAEAAAYIHNFASLTIKCGRR